MRADLPALLPLICPGCRALTERGREMFTVELERSLVDSGGEVEEGVLRCMNEYCGRRYPIVDGIPILLLDPSTFLRTDIVAVVERDLHPEVAALLALGAPDDAPYSHLLENQSIYLDAHWGDRALPRPEGAGLPAPGMPPFGFAALAEKLAERAALRVPRAVELGSGVGRGLAELARGADFTVGVDWNFAALRRARRLLAGKPLAYARRMAGRHYAPVAALAGDLAAPSAQLVCGDALDPPLVPGAFDRVAALNILDAVRSPPRLLSVIDGLCAPGGEVIVASPYSWQSAFVLDEHRLGGADPAAEVRRRLSGGVELEATYALEDEADLRWWLRRDARSATTFLVHYLRARKLPKAA